MQKIRGWAFRLRSRPSEGALAAKGAHRRQPNGCYNNNLNARNSVQGNYGMKTISLSPTRRTRGSNARPMSANKASRASCVPP